LKENIKVSYLKIETLFFICKMKKNYLIILHFLIPKCTGIALLELNNPSKKNALSNKLVSDVKSH